MKMVDLHTHSNISDGSYTPTELLRLAKREGLDALALTDHDSIAGLAEARLAAQREKIGFLGGMEMTVAYRDRILHIVALGFDETNQAFADMYRKIRQYKEACVEALVELVRKQYEPLTLEAVRAHQTSGEFDRYAVMRYFAAQKLFEDASGIWNVYLDPALSQLGEAYDQNISAEEALTVIHAAGGVTSLAHFHKPLGLKGQTRAEQESSIRELREMGLDGMERYYPNYTSEDAAFAAHMIDTYGLLPTGGTDFHGGNRVGISLGRGNGNMEVPYDWYKTICARVGKGGTLS